MTNTRKYPMSLSDVVAPERARYRDLVDAARAWQTGRERQTDPDLFTLICIGADESWDGDTTPTRWTRDVISGVLRCRINNWCVQRGCRVPDDVPEAMWEWFEFLSATRRLHPLSDPLAELRKPLACIGWLDERGRPLPPEADRVVECECFLPYRETAKMLGELAQRADRTGEDVLDALRRAIGRPTPMPAHPWADAGPNDDVDRWSGDPWIGDTRLGEPWIGDQWIGGDGDSLDGYGSIGLLDGTGWYGVDRYGADLDGADLDERGGNPPDRDRRPGPGREEPGDLPGTAG